MPVFGAPQVMFVRGQGTELWDDDGKRYLDFLVWARRDFARALQPRDRQGDRRAGDHADACLQLLHQRRRDSCRGPS